MFGDRIPTWLQQQENTELMTEIRRGFHTLKGSGRMVGADELGDFSWHIEAMLNALLEGSIDSFDEVARMVCVSEAILPDMQQRLNQLPTELTTEAIGALTLLADNIASGKSPDWSGPSEILPAQVSPFLTGDVASTRASRTESGTAAEPTLNELVRKELTEKLAVLSGLMERISRNRNTTASADEIIAIHTIAGTTALAPLGRESDVARALEGFLEAQQNSKKTFTDDAMWTVATCLAHFATCLAMHENDPEAALLADLAMVIRSDRSWMDFNNRVDELLKFHGICSRGGDGFLHFPEKEMPLDEYFKKGALLWRQIAEEGYLNRAVEILRQAGYKAWENSVGDIAVRPAQGVENGL